MLTICWLSLKRGQIIYKIFIWSLSDDGYANRRWIYSSVHLVSPLESSWVLSFITEESRSTHLRSRQSKRCISLRISRSFMNFNVTRHISEHLSQILQDTVIPSATSWRRVHRLSRTSHFTRLRENKKVLVPSSCVRAPIPGKPLILYIAT